MQASLCMVVRGGFILCMVVVVVVVGVGSLLPSIDTETQFKQRRAKADACCRVVSSLLYSILYSTEDCILLLLITLLYSTLIYSTVQYSTAIADDRRPTKPRSPNHHQHTGRGHHHHPSSSNPAIQQSSARCMCNCACPVWPL